MTHSPIGIEPGPAAERHRLRDRRAKERFVLAAGRALHVFGSPAHRLEAAMASLAKAVGLDGEFFSTPTAIFATFGDEDRRTTRLARIEPGDVDIEKLTRVDTLLDRVVLGDLPPYQAVKEIDAVVTTVPRWGPLVTTLSFAAVSGPAALFFGGGANEVLAATCAGLLTGVIALTSSRVASIERLFYPLAGMLVALTVVLSSAVLQPLSIYVVTLAALITLLPGLTLTTAMTELATRHLVSGGARLAGALLVFLVLGFGIALGQHLGGLLVPFDPNLTPVGLPKWTEAVALPVTALAFTVQFRAHPRDTVWMLLAGTVALLGGRSGASLLGPELGAFLGALLVGLVSNIFARLADRTPMLILLPGLMLLVPGSIGFRSLAALIDHQTLSGVQAAFTMTLVAIALVTGLLVANVIVPPHRNV